MEETEPATTLRQAYRNCSPAPLRPDHPWYVDLGPARGGDLKPSILKRFQFKDAGTPGQSDTWMRMLFLGLRGSGKTTEIHRLTAELRHKYEVVYLEANTELNASEFDLSELILSVAVGVERHMREYVHQPLPADALLQLQSWFAEVTHEKIDERVAQLQVQAKLAAEVTSTPAKYFASVLGMLKRTSTQREKVVAQIRKYPSELVSLANQLIAVAHEHLDGDRELLVVVDNLDRYNPETVDACLCAGVEHLRSLDLNLLLTPPVNLLLNPRSEPLNNLYITEFMFTPALRRPADPPDVVKDPGRALFRQALSKRLDLDAVFDPLDAVLDQVLQYTGGSLRDLMEHLREACVIATGPRLTPADIDTALRKRSGVIRDQVQLSGMADVLVQIERTHRLSPGHNALQLLYRRWVLKYNGEEWYALHPYTRLLPEIAASLGEID